MGSHGNSSIINKISVKYTKFFTALRSFGATFVNRVFRNCLVASNPSKGFNAPNIPQLFPSRSS